MTRAQFAEAIGVSEKWVHNARAALGRPIPYTTKWARRLTVAYTIQAALPMPLPSAVRLADFALATGAVGPAEFVPSAAESRVIIRVDLPCILSAFAVRLACAAQRQPRRTGRPPAPRAATRTNARERAWAYGIDLSLIDSNLRRTPDERLRALDANTKFVAVLRQRGRAT